MYLVFAIVVSLSKIDTLLMSNNIDVLSGTW